MRKRYEIAGLVVMEPVLGEEVAWTWANMRPEEKQEACEAVGFAREEVRGKREEEARIAHFEAAKKAERSFAIYHGDALLAIAIVDKVEGGRLKVEQRKENSTVPPSTSNLRPVNFLSMERTVNALAKGHRFAWLRGYGPLGRWISGQYPDGLWTVTPTDLPRALDVYRHAGAERTGETVKVGGREYWVLKIS